MRPGSIGSLAFVFADYADQIFPLGPHASVIYAAGSIAVLSAINVAGVSTGKWTQNVLTVAKVLGLLAVVGIGFLYSAPDAPAPAQSAEPNWGLAMILILYAYGGWNDMAYVSAQVRNPEKNIFRALMLGTLAVTSIYVLVNAAFLHALGLEGLRQAPAVAADVSRLALGDWGGKAVSAVGGYFRARRRERHDLHRRADLLRHGQRAPAVFSDGALERSAGHAGLVARRAGSDRTDSRAGL